MKTPKEKAIEITEKYYNTIIFLELEQPIFGRMSRVSALLCAKNEVDGIIASICNAEPLNDDSLFYYGDVAAELLTILELENK